MSDPQLFCTCVGEREEAPPEPNPDCPIHGDLPSPQANRNQNGGTDA